MLCLTLYTSRQEEEEAEEGGWAEYSPSIVSAVDDDLAEQIHH